MRPTRERSAEPARDVVHAAPANADRLVDHVAAQSARPNLELTTPSLDLGRVPLGQPRETKVSIINREPHAIELADVIVTGNAAIHAELVGDRRVEAGDYAVIAVRCSPHVAGRVAAQVQLMTASGGAVMFPVTATVDADTQQEHGPENRLPGIGRSRPLRFAWGESVDVTATIGHHRDMALLVFNDDDAPREVDSIQISGTNAFRVQQKATTIPPRSSSTIVVRFEPTTDMVENGALVVMPIGGPATTMMLRGHGTREEPGRSPPKPSKGVEHPRSQHGALLSPAPEPVSFGEQVLGSAETRRIGAPFNLTQQQAVAYFAVTGRAFTLRSASTLTLLPSGQMNISNWEKNSPLVEYEPINTHDKGLLTTTVVWGDGTQKIQTVELRGRGRMIDEAPTQERSDRELAAERTAAKLIERERQLERRRYLEDQKHTESYPQNSENDFGNASRDASNAAGEIAESQRAGVALLEKEAAEYRKRVPLPPPAIWRDLLEIGLTMATSGIAASVSKSLLPGLLGAIGGAPGGVKLSEFTTEVIKEGLKIAGRSAIAELGHSDAPEPSVATPREDPTRSIYPRIDFFEQQRQAHSIQAAHNRKLLDDRHDMLQPLLRSTPEVAINLMRQVALQLQQQKKYAEQEQIRVTAPLWATAVARARLGHETARSADNDEQPATHLDAARRSPNDGMPAAIDGLLDIGLEQAESFPKVVSARVHGISAGIAGRLLAAPLRDARIPVRFVLNPRDAEPTIVTRDETGRVRITGDLLYFIKFSTNILDRKAARNLELVPPRPRWPGDHPYRVEEPEAIAGATAVVERILSRSLVDWGVRMVEHDDAAEANR